MSCCSVLVSSPIEGGGRFLGLLLSFFSPSHGLSLPRSVSLCLSARESKGKNGKEGEERRKKKEESCCGKRNIEDGEFLLLLFFFFFFFMSLIKNLSFRPRQKNERRVPASAMEEKQRNKE